MSPHGVQVELPFEVSVPDPERNLRTLIADFAARRRSSGGRRTTAKPDIRHVNLELPLLRGDAFDVPDARFEYEPPADSTKKKPQLRLEDIPDAFDTPSIELCAYIAFKLLYQQLHVLLNERGSPKVKEEILDWVFAKSFRFAETEDTLSEEEFCIPMHKLPFTCQYCCLVEEIDYDDLCAAIHELVDQQRRPTRTGKTNQEVPHDETHNREAHAAAAVRREQQAVL